MRWTTWTTGHVHRDWDQNAAVLVGLWFQDEDRSVKGAREQRCAQVLAYGTFASPSCKPFDLAPELEWMSMLSNTT